MLVAVWPGAEASAWQRLKVLHGASQSSME